jgi:DNA-directed RNA polymerase subunit RPC12/RpoP
MKLRENETLHRFICLKCGHKFLADPTLLENIEDARCPECDNVNTVRTMGAASLLSKKKA